MEPAALGTRQRKDIVARGPERPMAPSPTASKGPRKARAFKSRSSSFQDSYDSRSPSPMVTRSFRSPELTPMITSRRRSSKDSSAARRRGAPDVWRHEGEVDFMPVPSGHAPSGLLSAPDRRRSTRHGGANSRCARRRGAPPQGLQVFVVFEQLPPIPLRSPADDVMRVPANEVVQSQSDFR